ncbi:NADPH:quinone reductase [Kineosporia sp. NBRC 101677]|uniref:alcohol dehydrogenase catalytic domain-containing protein n=1 Tax=Kineosporia sp. NBRC 101677 TaxID=3032197 RepID=UPI0024A3AA7B|nr:zinc-binding dehydrogenase [Kineosporia sp. NBRC 101677]GLY20154.1 NADPH:quinone reductase [Kineosporia sp. NBRC 101677]
MVETNSQVTQIVLPGTVEPSALQIRKRPLPVPGIGQALMKMEATGVSRAEQSMRRGIHRGQPAFPFVPGFDVVGRVIAVGPSTDPALIGRRYATITKIGSWASHLIVQAEYLVPVPEKLDAAAVETVLSHGVAAWQMLHRIAKVNQGQSIVVTDAGGGCGAALVQLGRHAGLRVIAIAPAHEHARLRHEGALVLDCFAPDLGRRINELVPGGAAAIFTHLGGERLVKLWKLVGKAGTLVLYFSLSTSNDIEPGLWPASWDIARLRVWNLVPNGRRARDFALCEGRFRNRRRRQWWHEDANKVLELLCQGILKPQIAAQFPLSETDLALTLAESPDVSGKVVIVPDV